MGLMVKPDFGPLAEPCGGVPGQLGRSVWLGGLTRLSLPLMTQMRPGRCAAGAKADSAAVKVQRRAMQ